MRVLKIHLVYGEDDEKSIATPLCVPVLSTWFSISVPDDQIIDAADLTLQTFQDQLADMIQGIQDIVIGEDEHEN